MLTKELLTELRPMINGALQSIGADKGVHLKLGNGSYCPESATFKLEITPLGEDGEVVSKYAIDFKSHCFRYDLTPEHLGTKFSFMGDEYELEGIAPRSRKYPFIARKLNNGKSFKLPRDIAELVKKAA